MRDSGSERIGFGEISARDIIALFVQRPSALHRIQEIMFTQKFSYDGVAIH